MFEKPHCGKIFVPFMKSITLFSSTIVWIRADVASEPPPASLGRRSAEGGARARGATKACAHAAKKQHMTTYVDRIALERRALEGELRRAGWKS